MKSSKRYRLRLRIIDGKRILIIDGNGIGTHIKCQKVDYDFLKIACGIPESKPVRLGIYK